MTNLSQAEAAMWIRYYRGTGVLPAQFRDAAPRGLTRLRDAAAATRRSLRRRDQFEEFEEAVKLNDPVPAPQGTDDAMKRLPQQLSLAELRADNERRWGVGSGIAEPAQSYDPRIHAVAQRMVQEQERGERPYIGARDLMWVAQDDMPGALAEHNKRARDYWDTAESMLGEAQEVRRRIGNDNPDYMGIGTDPNGHRMTAEMRRHAGPQPAPPLPPPISMGQIWNGLDDAPVWRPSSPGRDEAHRDALAAINRRNRRAWGQQ